METVTFKLHEDIIKKIDKNLRDLNFSNRTEFIRDAIRDKLNQAEKEEAIRKLASLKGSLKGKTKISDKEASKRASKMIAAKFGLKLD